MADYWKSNDRKFCDFCKCWIADNKPSIQFHENGRRHKANVEKRISDISKKAAKDEKSKKKMDFELKKMEEAAMAAYAQDISRNADMTSQNINRTLMEAGVSPEDVAVASTSRPLRPIDPLLPPIDVQEMAFISAQRALQRQQSADSDSVTPKDPTLWCEARSPDGYTYYWNVKTNESVWEAPKEGYLTLDEYNRINAEASRQQELQAAKECKMERENADEYVARMKRERLKQRRVQDADESIKRKWDQTEEYQAVDSYVSPGAGPYGKWETVVTAPGKNVDLQLPKVEPTYISPVLDLPPNPEPIRTFKEKVTKLDDATTSSVPGVFKKRKIQQKNSRQRLDDD